VFDQPDAGWLGVLEAFVWLRAFVLLLLLTTCLRAVRLLPPAEPAPPAEAVANRRRR
jgi:hypothetical protein